MHQCPHCRSSERQVKSGFNRTGSQRFQCQSCRRQYTPEPNPLGYDDKTREAALKPYLEGNGFRRIGRLLLVNHQSVANWVNAAHARLPSRGEPPALPAQPETLEVDELFTLVGSKIDDEGYISEPLFEALYDEGLPLVTRLKSGVKNRLPPLMDKMMPRRRAVIEGVADRLKNICRPSTAATGVRRTASSTCRADSSPTRGGRRSPA